MPRTPIAERDTSIVFQLQITGKSALGPEKPLAWTRLVGAMAKVRYGTSQERRDGAKTGAGQVATFRVLATTKVRSVTEAGCRIFVAARGEYWNVTGVAVAGDELEFTAVKSAA